MVGLIYRENNILPIFLHQASFHKFICHFYFFCELSIRNSLLFFPLDYLSFPYFLEVICIFSYQFLVSYVHREYILPVCGLSFPFTLGIF